MRINIDNIYQSLMTNSSSRQQTAWGFHPSRRLDVSQSSSWQFKKLEDSQSNEDF